MIISHRYRFIFIELPVSGVDFLVDMLTPLLDEGDVLTSDKTGSFAGSPVDSELGRLPRYARASQIQALIGSDLWQDYWTFSLVRNPFEHRVARYLQSIGEKPEVNIRETQGVDPSEAFEDYLLSLGDNTSYSDALCDAKGSLLIDQIVKYETLESDLKQLTDRLNLPLGNGGSLDLPPRTDYPGFYNFLTRDMVKLAHQQDLEIFGYEFAAESSERLHLLSHDRPPEHLIAHFGHHKSGTVWFQRVLKRLAQQLGWHFQSCFQDELNARTHIFMQENSRVELNQLPDYRGSHLIRDPRDMVISGYFYHLWCEESWCLQKKEKFDNRSYQEVLNSLDFEDGLALEIENCRSTLFQMEQWDYSNERIYEVRFEALIENQLQTFKSVFESYGLSADQVEKGLAIVEQADFERTTGRKRGHEAQQNHLRKGISGDWKNHFKQRHKQLFKSLYPNLLEKLGYESDDSW